MDHIMTYEEYLRDVKKGIVTDLGNSPVTPLLLMLQGKWKTQITMTIWFVLLSAGIMKCYNKVVTEVANKI